MKGRGKIILKAFRYGRGIDQVIGLKHEEGRGNNALFVHLAIDQIESLPLLEQFHGGVKRRVHLRNAIPYG